MTAAVVLPSAPRFAAGAHRFLPRSSETTVFPGTPKVGLEGMLKAKHCAAAFVVLIVLGAPRGSAAFQRRVVERWQPAFTNVFRPGLLQRSPARVQHSLPEQMWSSPRWTIAGEHAPTKAGIAFLPSGQQHRGDMRILVHTRTSKHSIIGHIAQRTTRFCHDCAWAARRNLLTESLAGELALSANAIFEMERAVSAVCPHVQLSSWCTFMTCRCSPDSYLC